MAMSQSVPTRLASGQCCFNRTAKVPVPGVVMVSYFIKLRKQGQSVG